MFKKGHMGYWKGKHFSEETRGKISEGNKGKCLSEETKALMGEIRKKLWETPQFREAMCNSFKGKQVSPESRNKISETLKRKYRTGEMVHPFKRKKHTEQSRRNMSLGHPDSAGEKNPNWGNHHSRETKKRLSEVIRMAWQTGSFGEVDWSNLNSGENNPMYGKHHSEKVRELIAEKARERFKDPEYREFIAKRILDGCRVKPNKKEQFLIDLIREHSLPFQYVGDGQFILGGKCPDFLNYNGKKQLIELYGDYWHQNDDPRERIDFFKQYGFNTLVIWEHELSNPVAIAVKIKSFGELVETS